MSEFRTIINPQGSHYKIGLNDPILTLGSCFSDAIGARLARSKFQTSVNPFGVIYNPVSIHRLLNLAIHDTPPQAQSYLQRQDVFLNYHLHSSFSSLEKPLLETLVNSTISEAHTFLSACKFILVTYGTSWVYSHKQSGEIVANCHKQPAGLFRKSLLNIEDIINSFTEINNNLLQHNSDIRIILTLSPVRHVKDTLELNGVSKATLRTACHLLAEKFSNVEYFPAYEIMMDDLRDYRFYQADMIHPNEQAEEYIWNRFMEKYMDEKSIHFVQEWKKIISAMHHRPFHPSSSGHQIFVKDIIKKLTEFKNIVDVDDEIKSIQAQLLDSFNTNKSSNDH